MPDSVVSWVKTKKLSSKLPKGRTESFGNIHGEGVRNDYTQQNPIQQKPRMVVANKKGKTLVFESLLELQPNPRSVPDQLRLPM